MNTQTADFSMTDDEVIAQAVGMPQIGCTVGVGFHASDAATPFEGRLTFPAKAGPNRCIVGRYASEREARQAAIDEVQRLAVTSTPEQLAMWRESYNELMRGLREIASRMCR